MVKQIVTDEVSILKRQARRRLLGAIALTILVVVLLPMVLDSEPPAPQQDIELQIPDKDKVGEFVPKMVLPPLDATASQPASAPAPVIAPLLDVKPVSAVVAQTKIDIKPVIEVKPVIDTKPVIEAKPVIASQPKVEQEIKQAEPKPKVEAKPAPKAAPQAHSGFVLQVGAFANADTAKKLQEKLLKQGYPSYTEKAGDKTRVRVGDYPTHDEADKVRRKLEIQGYQSNVINLK